MSLTKKQAEIRAVILDQLYAKRPISRIDISKETQITPATTGIIINEFIKQGFIQELGETATDNVGRKKHLLDIAPYQRYYIGLELSEKFLSLVIADNVGNIMTRHHVPVHPKHTQISDAQIIELIQNFQTKHPQYPVSAIAIGLPGYANLDESNTIIAQNPYWQSIRLDHIVEAFTIPVYFDNKSHCLALAERLFTYHNSDDNFIVYHVARGIHYSYIYNGQLYSHQNFLVGEVGHTVINPDGERCSCGKHGCLQVYASEAALISKAGVLLNASDQSFFKTLVKKPENITLQTILTAYQLGDLGAMRLINTACDYLTISISNLCQIINTDRIYLDGELFSYPIIAEKILTQFQQKVQLFSKQTQPELLIMPFSPFNAARAAISLCVYHDFLNKCNTTVYTGPQEVPTPN